jgi:NitT/TauT family transport system ATP-binding protein
MDIVVSNLAFRFGDMGIFADLSFRLPSGNSLAIVGRSGVGKTTLLRCVAGLAEPFSGSVRIDGHPPEQLYGKGDISFLFQEPSLWRHLTVRQHLELTFRIAEIQDDNVAVEEQLRAVGLTNAANLYPHQLSVGMKARTAIARAFCIPPKALLMDEPFAAVDPFRRRDLSVQVQQLRKKFGTTAVWVTHDVVEALQFATHILAIKSESEYKTFETADVPKIFDTACLPPEGIVLRNQILRFIMEPAAIWGTDQAF